MLRAAERRHVPLLTILVTVGVVAATYLAGKLLYRLKDILLLIVVVAAQSGAGIRSKTPGTGSSVR